MEPAIYQERQNQIHRKGEAPFDMECDKESLAGAVSQRACVFCGSRVVLYPIADALHLVHGPIGCAAYTWDIRGALSSGPELHRLSFSTDLQEMDVIFGGEKKLYKALIELIDRHHPKAAFVYSTCIVGIIGDDLEAVCKKVSQEKGIPVLPVQSEGFKGNKRAGYHAACEAMFRLVGTGDTTGISPNSVNILGDFNLAGEIWIIRDYFKPHGRRGGGQHHRRRPGGRYPPGPRRRPERGAVLRLHHGPGQDDAGKIRHSSPPGLLLRGGGHGRIPLRRGPVLQRPGDDGAHPGTGPGGTGQCSIPSSGSSSRP